MEGWRKDVELDEDALRKSVIAKCVLHNIRPLGYNSSPFTVFDVARDVCKNANVIDPVATGDWLATKWSSDIAFNEAILLAIEEKNGDASREAHLVRLTKIADDERIETKDRIAAIRLSGELQGLVVKAVDAKASAGTDNGKDFLSALADKLPN